MDPRPNPSWPLDERAQLPLHQMFALQVDRTPSAIALADREYEISFSALAQMTRAVSGQLLDRGLQKGDLIAIWADRAITLPVSLLSVLTAGCSFLILDPQYPAERLAAMIMLARPRAVIVLPSAPRIPAEVERSFRDGLKIEFQLDWRALRSDPKSNQLSGILNRSILKTADAGADGTTVADHFCCSDYLKQRDQHHAKTSDAGVDTKMLLQHIDHRSNSSVTTNNPAYIAFTSGTTGQPKGIIGRHAPVSHFLAWYLEQFPFGEGERFALLSGLAHDPLLRDIMVPFVSGGTLFVTPSDIIKDPQALRAMLVEERISVIHLTPSLGQLLVHNRERDIAYQTLLNLRWAFFGGEVLKYESVSQFCKLAPNARIVNFYGATETPQAMSYWQVESDHEDRTGCVPVGRGIADVQLLVVVDNRELAPIGEVGEVFIRTPYLADGYLEQSDLNDHRFLSNWFSNDPHDRLYRTGDLGVYRHDGVVELCGRSDRQVKIRGFRVELDEVEAVISRHQRIRQVAVELRDIEIIGYIVADGTVAESELRQFVGRKLPDFMVPSVFYALKALPLTPNGKVDRKKLAASAHQPTIDEAMGPKMSDHELRLSKLWREVLQVQRIERHDSFFDLGGDSMKGLNLLLRVEDSFGRTLPVNSLLRAPTVAAMAALLLEETSPAESNILVSIRDSGERPPVFWLPGGGGLSVMAFRQVSHKLGVQRPVYGLEAELDLARAPETLPAIVAVYKREILAHQSRGPYHLFGFSLGSFVAYELAVQLHAAGHEVGVLALFDTAVPVLMSPLAKLALKYHYVQHCFRDYSWSEVKKWFHHDRRMIALSKADTQFEKICRRNIRAIYAYAAKPLPRYDGKVTCILARDSWLHLVPPGIDPRLAWVKSAAGIDSYVVPGNHLSMLEKPDCDDLAHALRDALKNYEVQSCR